MPHTIDTALKQELWELALKTGLFKSPLFTYSCLSYLSLINRTHDMYSLLGISKTMHNGYFLIFQTLKQLTFLEVRWMWPNYSPLYFGYKISASLHNKSRNSLRKYIQLISEMLRKLGRAKFKHMRRKNNRPAINFVVYLISWSCQSGSMWGKKKLKYLSQVQIIYNSLMQVLNEKTGIN